MKILTILSLAMALGVVVTIYKSGEKEYSDCEYEEDQSNNLFI